MCRRRAKGCTVCVPESSIIPLQYALGSIQIDVMHARWFRTLGLFVLLGYLAPTPFADKIPFYIGTYTGGESKGIYRSSLNTDNGALSDPTLVAELENPSFLALHPSGKVLYAVSEVGQFGETEGGGLVAYQLEDESGELTEINRVASGGGAPCHLVVDPTGAAVLAANYSGGSVISVPIDGHGRMTSKTQLIQHYGSSVNPQRQKSPHGHSINLDPTNRWAIAADLGLDKLLVYHFDSSNGALSPAPVPWVKTDAGAGPRHFAFHPSGRFAYAINELHSTVSAYRFSPNHGLFAALQTVSTLPEQFRGGNSTAHVEVHPTGRFLYGSNRGQNSIAVFAIDQDSGRLSFVERELTQGRTPRNFGVDPSGRYLIVANQNSNNLVVFRVHASKGSLTATGHKLEIPSPVCIRFSGK